jgi:putative transposase
MNNSYIYADYRFPAQIIHGVCLYHRFLLSFRDIEALLAARGVVVKYANGVKSTAQYIVNR